MWRRIVSSHLKTLAAADFAAASPCTFVVSNPLRLPLAAHQSSISASFCGFTRCFSSESAETSVKKKVEDVMPIATGHEKEELEAELEGRRLLDIDFSEGPFGTKNYLMAKELGLVSIDKTGVDFQAQEDQKVILPQWQIFAAFVWNSERAVLHHF